MSQTEKDSAIASIQESIQQNLELFSLDSAAFQTIENNCVKDASSERHVYSPQDHTHEYYDKLKKSKGSEGLRSEFNKYYQEELATACGSSAEYREIFKKITEGSSLSAKEQAALVSIQERALRRFIAFEYTFEQVKMAAMNPKTFGFDPKYPELIERSKKPPVADEVTQAIARFEDGMRSSATKLVAGIDFTHPVAILQYPPGYVFMQRQDKDFKRGDFFMDYAAIADPSSAGISMVTGSTLTQAWDLRTESAIKHSYPYVSQEPVSALCSIAAPFDDTWSVPGKVVKTKGGGFQVYMPGDKYKLDKFLTKKEISEQRVALAAKLEAGTASIPQQKLYQMQSEILTCAITVEKIAQSLLLPREGNQAEQIEILNKNVESLKKLIEHSSDPELTKRLEKFKKQMEDTSLEVAAIPTEQYRGKISAKIASLYHEASNIQSNTNKKLWKITPDLKKQIRTLELESVKDHVSADQIKQQMKVLENVEQLLTHLQNYHDINTLAEHIASLKQIQAELPIELPIKEVLAKAIAELSECQKIISTSKHPHQEELTQHETNLRTIKQKLADVTNKLQNATGPQKVELETQRQLLTADKLSTTLKIIELSKKGGARQLIGKQNRLVGKIMSNLARVAESSAKHLDHQISTQLQEKSEAPSPQENALVQLADLNRHQRALIVVRGTMAMSTVANRQQNARRQSVLSSQKPATISELPRDDVTQRCQAIKSNLEQTTAELTKLLQNKSLSVAERLTRASRTLDQTMKSVNSNMADLASIDPSTEESVSDLFSDALHLHSSLELLQQVQSSASKDLPARIKELTEITKTIDPDEQQSSQLDKEIVSLAQTMIQSSMKSSLTEITSIPPGPEQSGPSLGGT